jgi:hypothetical protein
MNSAPTNFWQWTAALSSGERTGLLMFVMIASIAVVAIIAGTIYQMHKNRLEDSLKRELLERGMSAEEIATVIANTHKGGPHE